MFVANQFTSPQLRRGPGASLLWGLCIASFLALTGALDTDAANWPARAGYWVLTVSIGLAFVVLLELLLPWKRKSLLFRAIGTTFILLPVTGAALLTCIAMFGGEWSMWRLASLMPTMASMLVALQIPLLFYPVASEDIVAAPARERMPRELGRLLPVELREANLHALQAQDHYVAVHTSLGTALLRMRFADAMALTSPVPGVRTHRSWWVGRHAISEVRRKGRKTRLKLIDGLEVPVSPSGATHI